MSWCKRCQKPYNIRGDVEEYYNLLELPFALGCGHSFCGGCILNRLTVDREIVCHVCGKPTPTSENARMSVNIELFEAIAQVKDKTLYPWLYGKPLKLVPLQDYQELGPESKCFNLNCYNERFSKGPQHQKEFFCSYACQNRHETEQHECEDLNFPKRGKLVFQSRTKRVTENPEFRIEYGPVQREEVISRRSQEREKTRDKSKGKIKMEDLVCRDMTIEVEEPKSVRSSKKKSVRFSPDVIQRGVDGEVSYHSTREFEVDTAEEQRQINTQPQIRRFQKPRGDQQEEAVITHIKIDKNMFLSKNQNRQTNNYNFPQQKGSSPSNRLEFPQIYQIREASHEELDSEEEAKYEAEERRKQKRWSQERPKSEHQRREHITEQWQQSQKQYPQASQYEMERTASLPSYEFDIVQSKQRAQRK